MSDHWQRWPMASLAAAPDAGRVRPAAEAPAPTGAGTPDPRSRWQPWPMAPLERRTARAPAQRLDHLADRSTPKRRKQDQIDMAWFKQARQAACEQGHAEGHEAGYAAGLAEGLAQARHEQKARIEEAVAEALLPVHRLVEQFGRAHAALSERVADHLTDLALAIGRKLAGRALQMQPDHILDDVQGLLENYPGLSGGPTLHVAADDRQRIEQYLGVALANAGWKLRTDATLQLGDCRIEDSECEIDSTEADRWERLLQAVGHRQQ